MSVKIENINAFFIFNYLLSCILFYTEDEMRSFPREKLSDIDE